MALRSDWSDRPCPIARGIDALGDPWVLLVLRELLSGGRRFDEIREQMEVADNILAKRLTYMVEAGLVRRVPYREGKRPRYEYVPTAAAADALPILHAYALWAEKHTPTEDLTRRLVIICRACGEESKGSETCSECGRKLTSDNVSWIRPTSPDREPAPLLAPGEGEGA
ncbi:HxlR family transcriptional regulator [Streptomyces albireticuli]|uniref:HxlR family transcriptional regulator n=1 Tax=Streptomyces albireticuli TaxID=1940 RepID=A0A1Z2LE12_9ACTN|nr:helix-turn-helix domain-containing protein [Streptomyces albireticuli]ARZ72543.1 HxlR family transcriptional regulator [Streptomyces albireticuli]